MAQPAGVVGNDQAAQARLEFTRRRIDQRQAATAGDGRGVFRASARMAGERSGTAELHVIRLATKRVRYTLELFRPCYGPGLELRITSLQRLQQLLGEVNDCAAAER
ncbi:MAG: CHAD domain-containing protein [Ignavibacteriota bacterium]